jgi:hypothetical protein
MTLQALPGQRWMSAREPAEGPLDEGLRVFLDADTMRDDELVEVPRKQLFKRSPCEISIREAQSDVKRDAAMRMCNAL